MYITNSIRVGFCIFSGLLFNLRSAFVIIPEYIFDYLNIRFLT